MPTQRNIALITTGGTISSVSTAEGIAPKSGVVESMLLSDRMGYKKKGGSYVSGDGGVRLDVLRLFNKDSTDLVFEDRIVLAREVFEAMKKYDGIIVTHGTDTLVETAHSLSIWLKYPLKTIAITGAFKTIEDKNSDAWENLQDSITAACEGLCGVFVIFHGKVLQGEMVFERIDQHNGSSSKTFDSIFGSVALVGSNGMHYDCAPVVGNPYQHVFPPNTRVEPWLDISHNDDVFYIVPPVNSERFKDIAEKCDGIVVEATVSGGIPESLLPGITAMAKSKPIVLARRYKPGDEGSEYAVARNAENTGVIIGSGLPSFDRAVLSYVLGKLEGQELRGVAMIKGQFNQVVGEVFRKRLSKMPFMNGDRNAPLDCDIVGALRTPVRDGGRFTDNGSRRKRKVC